MTVMQSDQLARRVYDAMADDLAKIQLRVVTRDALIARFGTEALPQESMLRGGTRDLMNGGAAGILRRLNEHDLERIAEITDTMRMFEEVFAQQSDADMAAFADYIRKTYGKPERKPKAAGKLTTVPTSQDR